MNGLLSDSIKGGMSVKSAGRPLILRPTVGLRRSRVPGDGAGVKSRSRYARCRVAPKNDDIDKTPSEDPDPTPFFDPLLRTFVLGLGTGSLVEVGHVLYKFAGLATEVGSERVLQVFPTVVDRFSPLFVVDHLAAIGAWALLYTIEVLAVISFLKKKPSAAESSEELASLVTLSKYMLPINGQRLKTMILKAWNKPSASVVMDAPSAKTAFPQPPSSTAPIPGLLPKSGPRSTSASAEAPPKHRKSTTPRIPPPGLPAEPSPNVVERRRQELKERKSFLRNFWYAAAISDNVGTEPVGVEILSMNLVLFRGEDGKVRCLRDSCPHRSAPLSKGWAQKVNGQDCVVCPYHGWAIDDKGCIEDVPAAEGPGQWPKSPQVDAFVVEEKCGFIWLFYEGPKGNRLPADERPPIPITPELEDPNWYPVFGELEFECGHWAVFENAIDMAHIHYLHGDTFGNEDKPAVMNMEGWTDAYGVTTTFDIHNKPVSPLWNFSAVESVPVVAKALLPSTSMIKITLGAGIEFITFVCTVPIDENRCINRFALIRNFLPWPADMWEPWAQNAMYRILGEDKVMVEKLRPEETMHEVSVRADLPQIMFRKLRQEYINMGYGYTPQSFDQPPSQNGVPPGFKPSGNGDGN
ncbi:hypothetical protein BSKO_10579 [Bryopsis sp. KO-2023]|nr:hypothetical protein BSKO_10579 [Bryopsis sp. KO-2023]